MTAIKMSDTPQHMSLMMEGYVNAADALLLRVRPTPACVETPNPVSSKPLAKYIIIIISCGIILAVGLTRQTTRPLPLSPGPRHPHHDHGREAGSDPHSVITGWSGERPYGVGGDESRRFQRGGAAGAQRAQHLRLRGGSKQKFCCVSA